MRSTTTLKPTIVRTCLVVNANAHYINGLRRVLSPQFQLDDMQASARSCPGGGSESLCCANINVLRAFDLDAGFLALSLTGGQRCGMKAQGSTRANRRLQDHKRGYPGAARVGMGCQGLMVHAPCQPCHVWCSSVGVTGLHLSVPRCTQTYSTDTRATLPLCNQCQVQKPPMHIEEATHGTPIHAQPAVAGESSRNESCLRPPSS